MTMYKTKSKIFKILIIKLSIFEIEKLKKNDQSKKAELGVIILKLMKAYMTYKILALFIHTIL